MTTSNQPSRKVRTSDLQPGMTIARPDTHEFRGEPTWSCGMTTVKATRRLAKGDTVTVETVEHGDRFTAHGVPVKGWDVFVTFTDGTTLRASSNMNAWTEEV